VKIDKHKRKAPARKLEDMVLFTVQSHKFLITAGAVDEIRNLEDLKEYQHGFQSRFAKVKYTLVRAKKDPDKTYFVVDAGLHYGLPAAQGERVLVLRGSGAALLVENIDRMMQISGVSPLPQAFQGHEREWYTGLAVVGEEVIPVVEAESFLNKGEIAVLQATQRAMVGAASA